MQENLNNFESICQIKTRVLLGNEKTFLKYAEMNMRRGIKT